MALSIPSTNSFPKTNWHFPSSLFHDLDPIPSSILSLSTKAKILACAFEYARSVIPSYTSWSPYLAFMRIIIIGTIAEFKGELFDLSAYQKGDRILYGSYDMDEVLRELFGEGNRAEGMSKEYKTFLVVTSEKTRTNGKEKKNWRSMFFHRYRNALSVSPENWFRLRDCDALCRFTIAAALRCNDFEIDGEKAFWFNETQWRVLAEIGVLMYDSVAFYKHRAEGETNNTFAYLDPALRGEMFRVAREGLWGVDHAFTCPNRAAGKKVGEVGMERDRARAWMVVCNMLRFFGGPIHITMRRYRFVEEGLKIGREEDESVRVLAKRNEKLWWRRKDEAEKDEVGLTKEDESVKVVDGRNRFEKYIEGKGELFFDGFVEMLEEGKGRDENVAECCAREGGETAGNVFGARILSEAEREVWRQYALGFNDRLKRAFPEVDLCPALPT